MEKLVEKGLCKAIGISNFTIKKTTSLLDKAKIVPACNQGIQTNISIYILSIIFFLLVTDWLRITMLWRHGLYMRPPFKSLLAFTSVTNCQRMYVLGIYRSLNNYFCPFYFARNTMHATKLLVIVVVIFTQEAPLTRKWFSGRFCIRSIKNLKMLIFEERGNPENPDKNLSEQSKKPTTNITHSWPRVLNQTGVK